MSVVRDVLPIICDDVLLEVIWIHTMRILYGTMCAIEERKILQGYDNMVLWA